MSISKKIASIFAVSALSLTLAACGGADKEKEEAKEPVKTAKEVFVEGYKDLAEAKTYESSSAITFELSGDQIAPEDQMAVDLMNSMTLNLDLITDANKEKVEFDLGLASNSEDQPMNINMNLNMLADMQNNKAYMPADNLAQIMMFVDPYSAAFFPEELNGKLIELNVDETANTELSDAQTEEAVAKLTDVFNSLDESKFKKEGDAVVVTLSDADVKKLVKEVALIGAEVSGETVTEEEIAEFDTEIDKVITFDKVTLTSTFKDGQISSEKFDFSFKFTESGTNASVSLSMDTTYKNIGKEVTFNIDPETADVITEEELNALSNSYAY